MTNMKNRNNIFELLADSLSISSIFTWNRSGEKKPNETPKAIKTRQMSTGEYFDFLADSLSISHVVS